jgi:sugar phosphate isomerase/epimerase
MKIGVFAKTFYRSTIQDLFQTVAGYGIHTVQFNVSCVGMDTLPDRALSEEVLQSIDAAARDANVELSAISGTFNMGHPDPELRRDNLLRFEILCEVALQLRIPVITLCTGTRDRNNMWKWQAENDSKAAWNDMVRTIESALIGAEKLGLVLAFEPERENIVNSARRARQLLDELANSRLRIIIDPANLIFPGSNQREILDEAFALLSESITIAHAKDRDRDFNPCAAGKGILDFPYYVHCLKQCGFNGPLILHGLAETEVPFSRQFLADLL